MQTQTGFDLEEAVAAWRQELTTSDLTPGARAELDTLFRDTLTELRTRGLDNQESFWLACRRVGRSQRLDERFATAETLNPWRDRTFWMATGILAVDLWRMFTNLLFYTLMNSQLEAMIPNWVRFYLPDPQTDVRTFFMFLFNLARFLPLILFAVFLAKHRLKFTYELLNATVTSRKRFVVTALAAVLIANIFNQLGLSTYGISFRLFQSMLFEIPWTLSLIAIAAWLIRPKKDIGAATA